MHRRRPVGARIFILLIVALGLGPTAPDAATLTLGAINPLTGRFAAHGVALHQGIQLAVEEINASSTLRVTLASRDDEGRPDRAVAGAEELITRLRVAALVGGYVDTLVGPISEVAERQKVPYMATASLDERLTQRGYRSFFRISHLQAYMDSMVGVVLDLFRPRRAGILYSATPGASQLARRQRERLEQAGVHVPVFEMFTSGISDFTPFLTRVRDAGVEALISDAFFADHLVMVRQLRGLEVNVKAFLGAFGVEQYRRRFGAVPPPLAMHGYVAARAILAAAGQAESRGREVGPEAIRQALHGLDLPTPLQRLQFDSRGEARHYRRLIVQIQGAARVVVYPPDRATGKARYPMPAWKER